MGASDLAALQRLPDDECWGGRLGGTWRGTTADGQTMHFDIVRQVHPNLQPLQLSLLCNTRPLSCCSGSFYPIDSVFGRLQSCYPCIAVRHGQRCAACSLLLCVRRSLITSFGFFPGVVQSPQPLLKCIGLLLGRCDADAQPSSFCLIVDICCSVVCTGKSRRRTSSRMAD